MKALFLVFHGFEESNGISKKIHYQFQAFKEIGLDIQLCYYTVEKNGDRKWIIGNKTLINLGKNLWAKIKKRIYYKPIYEYIKKNNIKFVYIRSDHNANPFSIHLIKQIKKEDVKIVMEIPTYPYDQEYISFRMKCDLWVDKCFREKLARKIDAIVTFSKEAFIFGQHTIQISNGIDFSKISIKETLNDTSKHLHLIGVAEIHYWHGFDRIIKGLIEYYKNQNNYKVYFHIVGNLSGEREKNDILIPIKKHNIEEYIIMHGAKHGIELDTLFNETDMGIGSLGRHRSNITHIKTLKNREYAARGIPFIYSEIDEDFEKMPYILKVSPDETPVNIKEIVNFYHSKKWDPILIRDSIHHLSWKYQMEKVVNTTFSI